MTAAAHISPILRLIWPSDGVPSTIDWQAVDRVGHQHRLRPLFHHLGSTRSWPAPPAIKAHWQEGHRRAAYRALRQRSELLRIARLFADAGIAASVLKGGALVWRGWFDPALRPMRDLDLLVAEPQAEAAYALLRANGFDGPDADFSAAGQATKHLPGLTAPQSGVLVELHTRLIDPLSDALAASDVALRKAAQLRPAAADTGTLAALDDTATLLHVILHGVLDHQFNVGPLLLFDVFALLRHGAIDWPQFWQLAALVDSMAAVQLALRLAEAIDPAIIVDWQDRFPEALDAETVSGAAALLLIDTDRRTALGAAGRIARFDRNEQGKQLWQALRRGGGGGSAIGGLRRLAALGTGFAGALLDADHRRHVANSLAVARWLRGTI